MLRNVSLMRRSVLAVETPSAVSGGVCATASMLIFVISTRHEHPDENSHAKGHADGLIRIGADDAVRGLGALHRFFIQPRQARPGGRETRGQTRARFPCFFRQAAAGFADKIFRFLRHRMQIVRKLIFSFYSFVHTHSFLFFDDWPSPLSSTRFEFCTSHWAVKRTCNLT